MSDLTITRGRPMPFLDTLGNVLAIPNKLLFLNADRIGAQLTELSTEQAEYIGVAKEGPYKPNHYRY